MTRFPCLALALLLVACSGQRAGPGAEPEPESTEAETTSTSGERASCSSDGDCRVLLKACDCSCLAWHVDTPPPTDEEWTAMCDGQPPRNCGVASPCAERAARCDPTTHRCAMD